MDLMAALKASVEASKKGEATAGEDSGDAPRLKRVTGGKKAPEADEDRPRRKEARAS
jgi:hypothetical protein